MSEKRSSVRLTQRRPSGKEQMSKLEMMEFGTLTALPSSILTTLSTTDGGRRSLMRTGMPSTKQITKELKGKNGKSCTVTTER